MLLESKNVSVSYGKYVALTDVAIELDAGEFVSALGANSAGKTTLVNALSGVVPSNEDSEVWFDGQSLIGLSPEQRVLLGLIQVPERRQLFADMTVEENLFVGGSNKRVVGHRRKNLQRVYDLFPVLADRRTQRAGTLSGGEQQMVAVGRGLMSEPRLLMLDEPSMGLAPLVVGQMFDLLRSLTNDGLAILLIEQDLDVALRYASRGYVLERGEVVVSGAASDLSGDDRVRKAYLGL